MAGADSHVPVGALIEIALCIVQGLHERDPALAQNINFAAAKAYNRLVERGENEAAEIVYRFGRALLDNQLFPEPGRGDEAGV